MSIEDEIRAKKERMHAEEKKRQEHEILLTALRNVGMSENYPVLIFAPNELQSIISEALPYMRFFQPKIVRNMPDGHTYVRAARSDERPDRYSFDVEICREPGYNHEIKTLISVFKNGSISYIIRGEYGSYEYITWEEIKRKGLDVATIRIKIIEALARQEIQLEQEGKNS